MGDHVLWNTGVADNHGAELQSWKAADVDQAGDTDGTYKSLIGQLNGGVGTDMTAGINQSHSRLFEDIDGAHMAAINGLNQQQDDQSTGMQRAMTRLQG
ncbi:MAG TPA: hypothetical protein VEX15_15615 [Nocardioidaceae bacterium]|nr:hypothetical protein [Nocardioidaceae bacterium]